MSELSRSEVTGKFELVPIRELFFNHDEFAYTQTELLDGRSFQFTVDGRASMMWFTANTMSWSGRAETPMGAEGEAEYTAVVARSGYIVITADRLDQGSSTLLVVNFETGQLAGVNTDFVDNAGQIGERTTVFAASIDGAVFEPPVRTDELVGLRMHYRYSSTHSFEHIYINDSNYVWHGIEGPERGMGGFEPADYYRLADQLYLFTWHERASPFNGAILIDLVNKRTTGRLFAWSLEEGAAMSVQTGAEASILNRTTYPEA